MAIWYEVEKNEQGMKDFFGGDLRSDFPLKPFDDKWEEILKPHW